MLSLKQEFDFISDKIQSLDDTLSRYFTNEPNCKIVGSIPGFGVITTTLLTAMIDNRQAFSKASDIGVWVGLTPKQYASGNQSRLGGITKRGDRYQRRYWFKVVTRLLTGQKNERTNTVCGLSNWSLGLGIIKHQLPLLIR